MTGTFLLRFEIFQKLYELRLRTEFWNLGRALKFEPIFISKRAGALSWNGLRRNKCWASSGFEFRARALWSLKLRWAAVVAQAVEQGFLSEQAGFESWDKFWRFRIRLSLYSRWALGFFYQWGHRMSNTSIILSGFLSWLKIINQW